MLELHKEMRGSCLPAASPVTGKTSCNLGNVTSLLNTQPCIACVQAVESVVVFMQDHTGVHTRTASALVAKPQTQDRGADSAELSPWHLVCTRGV